jgi:hypothetical protein
MKKIRETSDGLPVVHLQGLGDVIAAPVESIRPGDRLWYNFGYSYTVVAVRDVTAKTIEIAEQASAGGRIVTRRRRRGSLVACDVKTAYRAIGVTVR